MSCQCGCGLPTTIAETTVPKHGYIKGQPRRFRPGHHFRGRKFPRIDHLKRYLISGECWLWTGPINNKGYGYVHNDKAHRLFYRAHKGPIGEGLELDHLCRNPRCVNPEHLEPVTHAVNLRRGNVTKLTQEIVDEIRALHKSGISQYRLAKNFKLDHGYVCRLVNNKNWKADV